MIDISNYNLLDLFHTKNLVKICAPMVRYSKFQFRTLVREYGCDLCFTPMILADSFCQSQKARENEFITNAVDQPLVVQFAANTVHDFVGAAYMASPYCNGVDLNCGCPQRWARCQGIGCVMLEKPELIYDIVRQCRNHITKPFTISVKMRIFSDIRKSVSICQQLEHCGVSFLTAHGRTAIQKTDDVNVEALRILSESVQCPMVANGGVKSLDDVFELQKETNCKGIMVANGILTNPAIFSGATETPIDCIQKWLDICYNSVYSPSLNIDNPLNSQYLLSTDKIKTLTYQCFHHHLVFMLEKTLPKKARRIFNNLQNFESVLEFLNETLDIRPNVLCKKEHDNYKPILPNYQENNDKYLELLKNYSNLEKIKNEIELDAYDYNTNNGKFFNSLVSNNDEHESFISDLFLEN